MERTSHSVTATTGQTGRPEAPGAALEPQLAGKPHFRVASGAVSRGVAAANSRLARRLPAAARRGLREVATVFAWEIRTFLLRPTSYLLLLAAAVLAGWSFSWLVTLLARGSDPALRPADDPIAQFLG